MKVVVLNASKHLVNLHGQAHFENAMIMRADELALILRKHEQPFVLLWHDSPHKGLGYLQELEESEKLPEQFQGCVFFRGDTYAGLAELAEVKRCIEEHGFTDETIHIVSSIVSSYLPDKQLLACFKNFTNAVQKLPQGALLPFDLLEPILPDSKKETLRSLVGLLAQLWKCERLPSSQFNDLLNHEALDLDFLDNYWENLLWLKDKNYQITEEDIRLLSEESSGLWSCRLCKRRYSITHTRFLRQLQSVCNCYLNKQDIDLKIIRDTALECVNELHALLKTTNNNPLLISVTGRLEGYLKQPENSKLSLTPVVQNLLEKKCALYRHHERLLELAAILNQSALQLRSDSSSADVSHLLKKIISESENLINFLKCADTNARHEVYLP